MPQTLPRPDARVTRREAALESTEARSVLWAAGDLLRESDAEGHVEARAALAKLSPVAARDALATVDVTLCARAVAAAIEGSFEAALEDDAAEREQLELAAMEDLEQRDVVECLLLAVTTFDGRADVDAHEAASLREAASVLRGAVIAADATSRPRARSLTTLNERRRERAGALDDAARASAWWWSDHAGEGNDGLVELLAGRDVEAGVDAVRAAERGEIVAPRVALGGALRAIDGGGLAVRDAERWAVIAAARSESDAIALELARTLDVSAIDEDAMA